ncbi:MAG: hypothetical protein U0414_15275 [Polyangiaceae bacterium]
MRSAVSKLLLVMTGVGFVAAGCAQIIGADFDKPFETSSSSTSGASSSSGAVGPAVCGDGVCSGNETNATCPSECPSRCGDNVCDTDENVCVCETDCPVETKCGDGCCSFAEIDSGGPDYCATDCVMPCGDAQCLDGETCSTCYPDCYCGATQDCRVDGCHLRDGQACKDNAECSSSNCVDTVCCTVPCGLCETCAADGSQCVPLVKDVRCPGSDVCANGQCQCANGSQDGTEDGVDCGGVCPPCKT